MHEVCQFLSQQMTRIIEDLFSYQVALLCGIDEPKEFVRRFIDYEREAYRS